MQLTAVFEQTDDGWYVAWIEEVPGAITQGATLDEARDNLQDALTLVIEARRELAAQEAQGRAVVREPFVLAA
ncbi:MAG: type II toxin-antitoxin system HicB family antitoxin [Candidatus Viridilinea halotolerans]|uniref:Type II toxin-antitoxin system HicB family antitoxin n=1 Tax=Candidatus Viridilinea halotolerans TaxID=2491704 RepID=A0A426TQZ6_9CHLR|nr:MAG: type II toxin-antitoxin system HicB family antitoxin [Candidatus Viridilinea halotolerans]